MALTATGLGSGLDISNIVSVLVDAEKVPKETIFNKTEASIKAKVSAVGTLKSQLSTFQDALAKLQDGDTLNQRKVTTGDSAYFTVSTTKSAQAGSYNIEVEQLAKPHKLGAAFSADKTQAVGEGSLDLSIGGNTFTVAINAADTLETIASKVNSDTDNTGVSASIVTSDAGSRIVFSSNTAGTDSQVAITATDSSGTGLNDMFGSANLTTLQTAQNSIMYIDGQKVTSQTNSVEGAISGVTIDVTKADINEKSILTIANDNDAVKETVIGFVDAYNNLMGAIDQLSSYDIDTKKAGALQGDSIIRSLESQLRNLVSQRVDVDGTETALYSIGISTDRYGKMTVDDAKLTSAINSDMDLVEGLFATETTGLANKLDDLANNYVKTGGLIDSRNTTYTKATSRLDDQREAFTLKMEQLEARLSKQFNAMDLIVASLNQQSSGLLDRLNSLPGVVRNS
ncbi:flagellar filament capping protein FliD [Shewanella sp. SG44-2]|uniref:flagellar filament capping protein FliD n=1 Tax=Shewanella sp. SG44-2 TaxID=2760962 RepID=UPI00160016B2|nr:flagellar filament capping protein FliD [Shewanella sp. SG44-2]MBB1428530.1 flagellar filament capping protein FliD [Shewanella sp. SG44-2]